MAHERKCLICGKEYKYCPKCREYNSNEKWRLLYCSEDCMSIENDVLRPYRSGAINDTEARVKLNRYSNVDYTQGTDYTHPLFAAIFSLGNEVVAEPVVEQPVEQVVEESQDINVESVATQDIEVPIEEESVAKKVRKNNAKKKEIVNEELPIGNSETEN